MNTIQCVLAVVPHRCPNRGASVVRDRTVDTGTRCSFHLKINVPSGHKTRKHSEKPNRISSFQSAFSVPYFLAVQPLGPANVCGGSKTTSEKVSSLKGKALKSARTSGFTTISRRPSRVSAVQCSRRLSTNRARPSARSNQNIRDPQHASKTDLLIFKSPLRV